MVNRRTFLGSAMGVAGAGVLTATAATAAEPGRNADQMAADWPWLGRYADANAALLASGQPVDSVWMGDSITEGWQRARPGWFGVGRINRGISGQTSPQMLARMMADVVALRPRSVHIVAGTNDVAGNTGPMRAEATRDAIGAMVAIARDAGIQVVVGSIPPASRFSWVPDARPAARIMEINVMLAQMARERGVGWIDYHAALNDGSGGIAAAHSGDGVHPNDAGYAVMEAAAAPVLARMRGRSRRSRR